MFHFFENMKCFIDLTNTSTSFNQSRKSKNIGRNTHHFHLIVRFDGIIRISSLGESFDKSGKRGSIGGEPTLPHFLEDLKGLKSIFPFGTSINDRRKETDIQSKTRSFHLLKNFNRSSRISTLSTSPNDSQISHQSRRDILCFLHFVKVRKSSFGVHTFRTSKDNRVVEANIFFHPKTFHLVKISNGFLWFLIFEASDNN
mmetsp:Transcript_2187/g.2964  ORF Transcript_2187/g.2964 Transcript_2187/m.2964 type:complete len:200 (+) Transcript_2187:330-929(+)